MNETSPALGHAIRKVIMNHQENRAVLVFLDRNHAELNKVELILKNYALDLQAGNDTWKETKTKLSGSLLTPITRKPSRRRFGKKGPLPQNRKKNNRKTRKYRRFKDFQNAWDRDSTLTTK